MQTRTELQPKSPATKANYQFDFTDQLASGETISTQTVVASLYSGVDADPSQLIAGAATQSSGIVTQAIKKGLAGNIYQLTCTVTTSGNLTLQRSGLLAIVEGAQ